MDEQELTAVVAAPGRGPVWWRALAAPLGPKVSAGRAYVEVVTVFGAFFGTGVADALLSLAGRLQSDTGTASWSAYGPAAFDDLAQAGLAVAVVYLLSRRRGCPPAALGLRLRRDGRGRIRGWSEVRLAAAALLALIVGAVITSALETGGISSGTTSAASLLYRSAHAMEAGFLEECVVLAFVVATLRQARRPLPEIVAVALVLRVSYHLYYGPGAIGIAVWALAFIWLFLRTQSLIPLIAVHCAWDLVATFGPHWPAVTGLALLVTLTLFAVAVISWLVERIHDDRKASPSPLAPPAGWYPDPWGDRAWRWWNGWAWTSEVSRARTA